jgi:hypothetical protein
VDAVNVISGETMFSAVTGYVQLGTCCVGSTAASISTSGNLVAYSTEACTSNNSNSECDEFEYKLKVFDFSNNTTKTVTQGTGEIGYFVLPLFFNPAHLTFSPEENKLTYEHNKKLYVVDL